jgi:hypothetical protein
MKALIVCRSVSHGNTAKVAQAIAIFGRVGPDEGDPQIARQFAARFI